MRGPLLIALALALSATAAAQAPAVRKGSNPAEASRSWTVFGLELGKPPAIPVCQRKRMANGQLSELVYEFDPALTCYETDKSLTGVPWRQGAIDFPLAKTPVIVKGNMGLTMVIDGNIEGLIFDTLGHSNSNAIVAELSQKFGKPTSVARTTASPSGIAVPAVEAEWRLPNLYVSYRNIVYSIDMGLLRIETSKMHALRSAHENVRAGQRTQL